MHVVWQAAFAVIAGRVTTFLGCSIDRPASLAADAGPRLTRWVAEAAHGPPEARQMAFGHAPAALNRAFAQHAY